MKKNNKLSVQYFILKKKLFHAYLDAIFSLINDFILHIFIYLFAQKSVLQFLGSI